MNKKNITIDTNFFQDQIDAKLASYQNQNSSIINGKQVSSRLNQHPKQSIQNTVNSYKYEYVPDNQYSNDYQDYQVSSSSTKKLQAANDFENIISRAMANLFVRCWEQLKAVLPQYQYIIQSQRNALRTKQILQDYNNVFNDQNGSDNVEINQQNIFSNHLNTLQNRKKEIVQRQRNGITLDSLQKLKLDRSKSGNRIHAQKDVSTMKPNQPKQTFVNEEIDDKESSRISRKSYRDKFLQYKHKSKSKQPLFQKSQTYTKFTSSVPKFEQTTTINKGIQSSSINRINNAKSASNIQESKNDILRNINHLLMDREDIYQGDDYKYYVNHCDSSKNIYSYENHSMLNTGSTFSKPIKRIYNNSSTQVFTNYNQQDQLMRAKLMEEIVQKLNYSKLRLQEVQKPKNQNNDQFQMIKKISRLEKVILELKTQTENKNQVKESHIKYTHKSQEEDLYRKFIQQIASIKAQINLIKQLRQYSAPPIQPTQPAQIIVDNSSSHIITEQRNLIKNYQKQFQRLLHQKKNEKVIIQKPQQPAIKTDTAQKSIFDQLIENGKNSAKKVGWEQGWEISKQTKSTNQQMNLNQQSTQSISKSRRRNQHLYKQDEFQNYRYTRKQILSDIGLRAQVEQEQRIWKQGQARKQLDIQKREIQFRQMTQKVKNVRKQQALAQEIERNKPIRQKHEHQWQKFQKTRIDVHEDQNFFCQLFPCQ